MNAPQGIQTHAVLYVDDEESSLKYFRLTYEKDLTVLTAKSVPEARSLLQAGTPPVAVLISDQRMPGETGTDLLAEVRRTRPEIIRILTTAYSDTDSAIDAVNAGEVHRYVVKPWDARALRATLLHAMELFSLRQERDMLLREKLSVRQRMLIAERLRSLGAFAAALEPALPGVLAGFVASLGLLPEDAFSAREEGAIPRSPAEMAERARRESVSSLRVIEQFSSRLDLPSGLKRGEAVFGQLLEEAIKRTSERRGALAQPIHYELPGALRAVSTSPHLCVEALSALFSFGAAARGPLEVTVSEGSGAVSVSVCLRPDPTGSPLSLSRADSPVLELVLASLLAHHLRGSISVNTDRAERWQVSIVLPIEAANIPAPTPDDCALARALDLEDIFW
jgi:CheY-like chemotaxis protein